MHNKNKLYGYHRLETIICYETSWKLFDNLAYKYFKHAGIKSKHYRYCCTGEEHIIFQNKIYGNRNPKKVLVKIVVSDMAVLKRENIMNERMLLTHSIMK